MQSQESFRAFYDATLLPVLQELEVQRKMLMRNFMLYMAGAAVAALPLLAFVHPILAFLPFAVAFVIYYVKHNKIITEKKLTFKQQVIGKIVSFLHGSLSYNHAHCISESTYHKSKLYLDSISRYKGDDLVSGTIDKTNIRFCELHTQQVRKSGKNTQVVTIFQGLFFVADFNKNFIGETFVLPDTAENAFGSLGTFFQKMNMSRPKLVKLEDIEFEKAFAVYGTDQIEARYILSTSLMQRIMEFRKKTKREISLSFIQSHVYIGIPVGKDLFEAPVFSSLINYPMIAEYYTYLALCIGIVEDLDLNTRIWTKE